jgi:predicted XRE-type DNA-binding protein
MERTMKEKVFVSRDNVFSDLGLVDSEEMKIRSDLMSEVVKMIRNSGILQKEIATILGITAPKVSALMSGKINDFSNDTLMQVKKSVIRRRKIKSNGKKV